jgi:hypothetical protein
VNLGIKAFEDSSFHSFEVFSKPVDLEHSRDRIHESFIAFQHGGPAPVRRYRNSGRFFAATSGRKM